MGPLILSARTGEGIVAFPEVISQPYRSAGTNIPICFWTLNCSDSETNSSATSCLRVKRSNQGLYLYGDMDLHALFAVHCQA
jgi:hypothetical protein